jgi:hypothetical protein
MFGVEVGLEVVVVVYQLGAEFLCLTGLYLLEELFAVCRLGLFALGGYGVLDGRSGGVGRRNDLLWDTGGYPQVDEGKLFDVLIGLF